MALSCSQLQSQNVPGIKQYPVENLCVQEDKIDHFKILMAQLFNKTILTTDVPSFYNLIENFFIYW
jgi:hypothetical protein